MGKLYVQVLIGVAAGVALGVWAPQLGSDLKPLGDVFIKLIKMVFGPIIFATVVLGLARMENMKERGAGGWRALLYFEVLSTLALRARADRGDRGQARARASISTPSNLDTKAIATLHHSRAS